MNKIKIILVTVLIIFLFGLKVNKIEARCNANCPPDNISSCTVSSTCPGGGGSCSHFSSGGSITCGGNTNIFSYSSCYSSCPGGNCVSSSIIPNMYTCESKTYDVGGCNPSCPSGWSSTVPSGVYSTCSVECTQCCNTVTCYKQVEENRTKGTWSCVGNDTTQTCSGGTYLPAQCDGSAAACDCKTCVEDGTACNAKNASGKTCTCKGTGSSRTCILTACAASNCTKCSNGAACGTCYQVGWSCDCSGVDSCDNSYKTCSGVSNSSCVCTPTNSGCAANTCTGSTCNDGCNDIPGTKDCPVGSCIPVTCSSHNGSCGSSGSLNSCDHGNAFNKSTTTHSSTWYCPGYKN